MAAAKMRHFNSPEEVAKRDAQPPGTPSKPKEFRHYNHPDEVAKRAAAGKPSAIVAPPRQRPPVPAEPWPPPGQPNNAPVTTPVVMGGAPVASAAEAKPDTAPPPPRGDAEQRLRRLETLVYTFVESTGEARDFRRLLNNQQAVTDSQQDLVNRVRSLEEAVYDEAGDDDADDAAGDDAETLELGTSDTDRPEGA